MRLTLSLLLLLLAARPGFAQGPAFGETAPAVQALVKRHLSALQQGDRDAFRATLGPQVPVGKWIDDSLLWVKSPRTAAIRQTQLGNFEIQDLMSKTARVTNQGAPALLVLVYAAALPKPRYPHDALALQPVQNWVKEPGSWIALVVDEATKRIVMPDPRIQARR
jgi:hypothetical protein